MDIVDLTGDDDGKAGGSKRNQRGTATASTQKIPSFLGKKRSHVPNIKGFPNAKNRRRLPLPDWSSEAPRRKVPTASSDESSESSSSSSDDLPHTHSPDNETATWSPGRLDARRGGPVGERDTPVTEATLRGLLAESEARTAAIIQEHQSQMERTLDEHRRSVEATVKALRGNKIECPICLVKDRNMVIARCGHTFCSDCAWKYKVAEQFRKECPMCQNRVNIDPTGAPLESSGVKIMFQESGD